MFYVLNPEFSSIFTGSVQPPHSGTAAVYMRPTRNERLVLCKWSHARPDTVLHYNAKTYINETLISTAVIPSGTLKEYNSTVSQGTLHLEIEAVDLCGHTATHVIDDNAFQCKSYVILPQNYSKHNSSSVWKYSVPQST